MVNKKTTITITITMFLVPRRERKERFQPSASIHPGAGNRKPSTLMLREKQNVKNVFPPRAFPAIPRNEKQIWMA